jgi:hypothetical protein
MAASVGDGMALLSGAKLIKLKSCTDQARSMNDAEPLFGHLTKHSAPERNMFAGSAVSRNWALKSPSKVVSTSIRQGFKRKRPWSNPGLPTTANAQETDIKSLDLELYQRFRAKPWSPT